MNMETAQAYPRKLNWDFLQAVDLAPPNEETFLSYHVYRGGEVLKANATWEQLVPLCGQIEFQADAHDVLAILRDDGFLVETVFDKAGFRTAMGAYALAVSQRETAFRDALFEQENVVGNPRAELCFEKAREACHFEGKPDYRMLAERFIDLAELIR